MAEKTLIRYHGSAMGAWGLSTKRSALKERLRKNPKNKSLKRQIATIDTKLKRISDNAVASVHLKE